jgi:hypothetical protein
MKTAKASLTLNSERLLRALTLISRFHSLAAWRFSNCPQTREAYPPFRLRRRLMRSAQEPVVAQLKLWVVSLSPTFAAVIRLHRSSALTSPASPSALSGHRFQRFNKRYSAALTRPKSPTPRGHQTHGRPVCRQSTTPRDEAEDVWTGNLRG